MHKPGRRKAAFGLGEFIIHGMLNYFEEINHFFKNNRFSDSQLNELKIAVKEKYSNKETLKAALAIIELNVLKYNLQHNTTPSKPGLAANVVSVKKYTTQQFKNRQMISWLTYLTMEELREVLEVNKSLFTRMLQKHNIALHEDKRLSSENFALLSDFIISKYKSIIRKGKMQKQLMEPVVVRTKIQEEHKGIKVYDAIATHGLGKMIYIRKQ